MAEQGFNPFIYTRQWRISLRTASTLQEYDGKLQGAGRWKSLTEKPGPLADALRRFTFSNGKWPGDPPMYSTRAI